MLVLGLSLATAEILLAGRDGPPESPVVAAVVGLLLVYLHVRPQRKLALDKNVASIQLDEVLFVPMLILLPPAYNLVIMAVAALAGSISTRRTLVKAMFNVGQLLTAGSIAILVARLVTTTIVSPPSMLDVLGGMVAALVLTGTSAILVRGMVGYATGLSFRTVVPDLRRDVVAWIGAVILGGVGTVAIGHEPLSAVLVLFLLFYVQAAYASSMRELAARHHAERVQQAIATLRNQTTRGAALEALSRSAREVLGAVDAVTMQQHEPSPHGALDADLGSDLKLVVTGRRGSGTWTSEDGETLRTLVGVARDVLRSTDLVSRLRALTNSQSEGVLALNLAGQITFANPAALSMLGYGSEDELALRQIGDVCSVTQSGVLTDMSEMVRDGVQAQDVDATLVRSDGDTVEVAYSLTPLRESYRQPGAVLVLRDVTERRALQNAIAHRALHDELTGLPNRRLLLDRLDHALARVNRNGGQHGLLFFDLDRFKLVNDSFGHLAGDRLLVDIADRLRGSLSSADTLARFSGDEFVVLVEDVDSVEEATKVAERLRGALEKPFELGESTVYVSASIGVTVVLPGQPRDEVLAAADRAAYVAKASGRNNVQVAEHSQLAQSRSQLDLEAQLHRAIETGTLELHFQPILRTSEDTVVGVEALVRWPTKDRGLVKPEDFIPVAEDTGQISALGHWVLEHACATMHRWTVEYPDREPLRLSVNVSPHQFSSVGFTDQVAKVLSLTGLDPHQLCLEITESVLMADSPSVLQTMRSLRDLGVQVAVDDFGVGYSSLSYLKRFPVDIVKLDRSFTSGLGHDVVDGEIVATVLRLTETLGIEAVAEGVETSIQRKRLTLLGCRLMQGYLASRPLPEGAFLTFWGVRSQQRLSS